MTFTLVITVLVSATIVTLTFGQTFSYIDRPLLVSGDLKANGKSTSVGSIHCSAINVKYRAEHREIFGVVFTGGNEPKNTRVFSVEIEKGDSGANSSSCAGISNIDELMGPYHEVKVPYGECNIAWNRNDTLFTYSATILIRVRVYYTSTIYHEYRLRQPFTCAGDNSHQIEFNVEYLAQIEDLPELWGTFSIELKADIVNDVSQSNNAELPSQSLIMSFALYDNMTDMYDVFVDECWGNFDQNRNQEPRITLISSQGCQIPDLSERIEENPIRYRFPAFQFDDASDVEEQMFIHCNVNFCRKNGFREKCTEVCSGRKVGPPLLNRVGKRLTDEIPYPKYIRSKPQFLSHQKPIKPPVMVPALP